MTVDVPAILQSHGRRVARFVDQFLGAPGSETNGAPARLIEAIRYSFNAGGKRLRPALAIETCLAVTDADPDAFFGNRPSAIGNSVLAAASAMELIHTFSLVHDDLPAMDDDDLRRGKPTNHKVFGEAMAILAGDAMMTLAFEMLSQFAEADRVPALVGELARASGPAGMIGGQALDIESENQSLDLSQLQRIHQMKTGALLTASCRLGAICARADDATLDAVTRFGRHVGLAFQIIDDVLDETSTRQQLGKATQKDRAKGKNTYPKLLGLEQSRAEAARQLSLATEALAPLGTRADRLLALARFIADRNA